MARHCVMGYTCHLVFSTICKVGIVKESICTDEETAPQES